MLTGKKKHKKKTFKNPGGAWLAWKQGPTFVFHRMPWIIPCRMNGWVDLDVSKNKGKKIPKWMIIMVNPIKNG